MSLLTNILSFLPQVKTPEQKNRPFKEKLKWTLIILVAFFILSVIPLYGLGENGLARFEQLSIILGASFGSIMSLGIGPIVTASIVLQLLSGSGILKLDLTTKEGKSKFQGLQKIAAIFFIIFEAGVYVFMGGLAPNPALAGTSQYFTFQLILIGQLIVGGFLVLFMDEVINKFGFGSGISLFIAGGVASEVVVRAFSPLNSIGQLAFGSGQPPVGAFLVFFTSLLSGAPKEALIAIAAIIATVLVFVISVYAQAMKVEIPLSFGRVRGFGVRWPLNFLYTSNIPVILISALLANIQLGSGLLQNWGLISSTGATELNTWLSGPQLVTNILTGSFVYLDLIRALVYIAILALGSVIFSIFWVQTAGMDAASQAKQIRASGLSIAGFRTDERILEKVLQRYIFPLTIMGGLFIGIIAATADLLGALSRGTGILLAVMIIYKLYEDIAKHHMMDMHPAMKKMMGGS
ncbi:preprotein translocase subunit SecY [Candidatus Woesearchaeota archaeon]|nr:MAG: preprotein translocase subunit SecY [archaeon GW2011_AR18]MBS3161199.1 preprotein translocase subunit SecY [Candidatus Woesearchaeota archaeon]